MSLPYHCLWWCYHNTRAGLFFFFVFAFNPISKIFLWPVIYLSTPVPIKGHHKVQLQLTPGAKRIAELFCSLRLWHLKGPVRNALLSPNVMGSKRCVKNTTENRADFKVTHSVLKLPGVCTSLLCWPTYFFPCLCAVPFSALLCPTFHNSNVYSLPVTFSAKDNTRRDFHFFLVWNSNELCSSSPDT